MEEEGRELRSLIIDYKTYKSFAEASIDNNPYHAYFKDLTRVITMCNNKIKDLEKCLENIKEKDK